MDFPGTALSMLQHYLLDLGWRLEVENYSAIDPCPDSRAVILAKRPGQRPRHFFESILDRVPQETLKALLGTQVSSRERGIQQVQEATSEGGTEQGKAARTHFVSAFGQHFAGRGTASPFSQ